MSAEDNFEITLRGVGGHASRPQSGREVLVAACALVINLQTIVSRRLSPTDTAVVSVTELITDGTRNVLPGLARILGDARSFRPQVSAEIEKQMRIVAEGTALTYNCAVDTVYSREFVPLINDAEATDTALAAAATVFGADATSGKSDLNTASEDFARFLDHVPGCFAFIGNGEASAPLHNPTFDFNDAALLGGARYHAAIARQRLPMGLSGSRNRDQENLKRRRQFLDCPQRPFMI
jgi:hippurate hydrolase